MKNYIMFVLLLTVSHSYGMDVNPPRKRLQPEDHILPLPGGNAFMPRKNSPGTMSDQEKEQIRKNREKYAARVTALKEQYDYCP